MAVFILISLSSSSIRLNSGLIVTTITAIVAMEIRPRRDTINLTNQFLFFVALCAVIIGVKILKISLPHVLAVYSTESSAYKWELKGIPKLSYNRTKMSTGVSAEDQNRSV